MGYGPGLLFVRILNPVPRMSWLACVWKTVIRLPMFPVYATMPLTQRPRRKNIPFNARDPNVQSSLSFCMAFGQGVWSCNMGDYAFWGVCGSGTAIDLK